MKSGYLGVHWNAQKGEWMIRVNANGKQHTVGYRRSQHEAARAYNYHAVRLKGPDAKLNQVPEHLK